MKIACLSDLVECRKSSYGKDLGEENSHAFVVKVSNVSGVGEFHGEFEKRSFTKAEVAQLTLRRGDLCVVKSSGSKTSILSGKTALVTSDTVSPLIASNFCFCLRPDTSVIEPRYLWRVLNSPASKLFVKTVVAAFTYPNLKWSTYSKHPIPLPPLPEQKRIAAILDAADALRAKRRESIEQLDSLVQATFLEMFGDPVTNPKGWRATQLRDTGTHAKVGPFGSLLHKSDYETGGVPLVNPKHMRDGVIEHGGDETVSETKAEELDEYRLRQGDVLMGRRGEMGRCAVIQPIQKGWLCGTGSVLLRPSNESMTAMYLYAFLSSQPMRRQLEQLSGGAIMPSLSGSQIQSLPITIPPLDLQNRFAAIVESIEHQKTRLTAHLAELDALFSSFQSRAFNGELVA